MIYGPNTLEERGAETLSMEEFETLLDQLICRKSTPEDKCVAVTELFERFTGYSKSEQPND